MLTLTNSIQLDSIRLDRIYSRGMFLQHPLLDSPLPLEGAKKDANCKEKSGSDYERCKGGGLCEFSGLSTQMSIDIFAIVDGFPSKKCQFVLKCLQTTFQ